MLKPLLLKNGLTVLRLPKPSSLFIIGFIVPTGYSIERFYYKPGIAYLVEKLFSTGTDKHQTKRSLQRALESLGGKFYTQTSAEFTGFYLTVPQHNQFKAVSLLAEIIQHSVFDPKDIENEKKAIIEEIRSKETHSTIETTDLAIENIFSDYAYSQKKYESAENIHSIEEEDLLDYLQSQFAPSNCFLVTSGNFQSKEIADQVTTEWSFWAPKTTQPKYLRHLNVEELIDSLPRVHYKQRGGQGTVIDVGFLLEEGVEPRVLRETSEEAKQLIDVTTLQESLLKSWAEVYILNALLGQGISSRLWVKGVEEETLFDTISSEIAMFARAGFLHISAFAETTQFGSGLETILNAIDGLRKTNVPPNELDRAKEIAKGSIIVEHEDLLFHTIWMAETIILSGLAFTIDELLLEINKVDSNSLRKRAQNLFVHNRFFLTTLGTSKESGMIERLVQKYLS